MHPWLATYIWVYATFGASAVRQDTSVAAPEESSTARVTAPHAIFTVKTALPLAIAMRLSHLRDPIQSGLPLMRFYSDRYRSF